MGVEGGGTHTTVVIMRQDGTVEKRIDAPPGNIRLLSDTELSILLSFVQAKTPAPSGICLAMAGVRTQADARRVKAAAARCWPGVPCLVTNDLESALAAAPIPSRAMQWPRVLVLSGTGSCCYGQDSAGNIARSGGWGHLLGDRGSGYYIGYQALRTVIENFDHSGKWPRLGQEFLRALQFNEPEDLIAWIQNAGKESVAMLAREVFVCAQRGDSLSKSILAAARTNLTNDALACARKLAGAATPVVFVLTGGILQHHPSFAQQIGRMLRQMRPGSLTLYAPLEGALGAACMARNHFMGTETCSCDTPPSSSTQPALSLKRDLEALALSPTEQRNPRSLALDRLKPVEIVELMLSEDALLHQALLKEKVHIAQAMDFIVRAFKQGGRLFYTGAGTSGRLGVLDASECPPTFRTPPEWVQGIMAGGQAALWSAVEGAEDDFAAGERAIAFRNITSKDVVVGIAASGRTPFIWGSFAEARRRKARTVLVACNPFLQIRREIRPNVVIAPNTGPEILTGSTRLKAGTATKLILNILTTGAMVRMGKTISNLMVDLNPSNVKLRDRAIRIIRELTGVDAATAQSALEKHHWVVKDTWQALRQ